MTQTAARPRGRSTPRLGAAPGLEKISETAARLRASESHVYRLITLGLLEVTDIALPGSRKSKTRVLADSTTRYIEKNTRRSVAGQLGSPETSVA
jgi:hypothetical protein